LLAGFERLVIRDTTLPDGTVLEKGTHIAVHSRDMWSSNVYDNPNDYDPWRFVNRRKAGVTGSQFVQSNREHNAFGTGRHQCPGRFFANNELKLCFLRVLLGYDVRMAKDYTPKHMHFGLVPIADPAARIEIRRRM